jgi:hypothetical protein
MSEHEVVRRELEAFASGVLGMTPEDIASTTAKDSERLLRLKLAYESKDMAPYACSMVDADAAKRIRDWDRSSRSPPAFYRYVFSNAQVRATPHALERFKDHVGVCDDARALRLFHAVNFGCPRDEMLDVAGNNRTQANEISNQLTEYARDHEGGDRSVFQEEWGQFLKDGIEFPFFEDGRVILNVSSAASGAADVEEREEFFQVDQVDPVDKPIPFGDTPAATPVVIVGNPLLDSYRKRAGLPLTLSLHTAAKQLVSALVCKQIPVGLLHRDQDPDEVSEAVHGLAHLTRENFGPLVKASVNVEAVRDMPECREFYWKGLHSPAAKLLVSDSAEFVADALWHCVQQKKTVKGEVV